jgi:hypothetical protein
MRLALLVGLLLASLVAPQVVYADDCSSLGDCFTTAQQMYGSLAFLTLGLALLFAWIATGPTRASGGGDEAGADAGSADADRAGAGGSDAGGSDAGGSDAGGSAPGGSAPGGAGPGADAPAGDATGSEGAGGSGETAGDGDQMSMSAQFNADGSTTFTNPDGTTETVGGGGEMSMSAEFNPDGSTTYRSTTTVGGQQTSTTDVVPGGSGPGAEPGGRADASAGPSIEFHDDGSATTTYPDGTVVESPAPESGATAPGGSPSDGNGATGSAPAEPSPSTSAPTELGPDAGDQLRIDRGSSGYDIETRNADGGVTTDSFDVQGNPTGTTTITTYPDGTQQAITTTADGKTTVIEHFDADGQATDAAIVKENADGSVTRYNLDVGGGGTAIGGGIASSETVGPDGLTGTTTPSAGGGSTTAYTDGSGNPIGTVTIQKVGDETWYTYSGTDGATTTVVTPSTGGPPTVGTSTPSPGGVTTTVTTPDGTTLSSGGASGSSNDP